MKRRRFMAGAIAVTLMPAPSFGTVFRHPSQRPQLWLLLVMGSGIDEGGFPYQYRQRARHG